MQLNNNGDTNSGYLPIFDCSWISRFNGEEEKLFIGGLFRIRIESIIRIENYKNYAEYLRPLYYFDCMLSGSEMPVAVKITTKDIEIIKKLIYGSDDIEEYIKDSFTAFCQQKTKIIINLLYITNLAAFADLLYNIDELIIFNEDIFTLFNNLKEVIIYCDQYGTEYQVQIFENYLKKDSLFGIFKILDDVTIILRAHHPSWISKFRNHQNKESSGFSVLFGQTANEDCLTVCTL